MPGLTDYLAGGMAPPVPATPLAAPPPQMGTVDRLSTAPGAFFGAGMRALGQGNIGAAAGNVARSVVAAPAALAADVAQTGPPIVGAIQNFAKGFVGAPTAPAAPAATAVAPVAPAPLAAKPAAPAAPAVGMARAAAPHQPIDLIEGGHYVAGAGGVTNYDMTQLAQMYQPRMQPAESAGNNLLDLVNAGFQHDMAMAKTQAEQQAALLKAAGWYQRFTSAAYGGFAPMMGGNYPGGLVAPSQ